MLQNIHCGKPPFLVCFRHYLLLICRLNLISIRHSKPTTWIESQNFTSDHSYHVLQVETVRIKPISCSASVYEVLVDFSPITDQRHTNVNAAQCFATGTAFSTHSSSQTKFSGSKQSQCCCLPLSPLKNKHITQQAVLL